MYLSGEFGKKAKDLDLAEAAILTGIPKSPSNYSPLINYDKAKERQILILKNLLKEKKISNEEYNQASNEKLTFVGEKEKEELSTVMYYQDAVMKELNSLKEIPSTFLETGGLKIYTSLNLKSQKELEANVKETLGDNELETAAKNYPDQQFAIIDHTYEKQPENITSLSFESNESSYLAGLIAGKSTKTNKVAFIGGQQSPVIDKFEYGFKAGVLAANFIPIGA